jgi:hypothetical protein
MRNRPPARLAGPGETLPLWICAQLGSHRPVDEQLAQVGFPSTGVVEDPALADQSLTEVPEGPAW